MDQQQYRYNAFISYRHTDLDKFVAEKLHKLLETFKVPKIASDVVGKDKNKKITRVFRDKDELPLGSSLADHITLALEQSQFLIVICSPRTAQSMWVQKEIDTFISLHGVERVLAVLVDGEPEVSFPEKLRFEERELVQPDGTVVVEKKYIEPLAADVRGKNKHEVYKNLKKELLRLVAPMLSCSYDDLKQRHKERRNRRILTVSVCAAAFFLLFGSFSSYQALKIKTQSNKIAAQSNEIKQSLEKQLTMQSSSLADASLRLLGSGDRVRAILLAQAALPKTPASQDRPFVMSAQFALSKALYVYENGTSFGTDRILEHEANIAAAKLNPSGTELFSVDDAGKCYVWNCDNGKLLRKSDKNIILSSSDQLQYVSDKELIISNFQGTYCIDTETFNTKWKIDNNYSASNVIVSQDRRVAAVAYTSDLIVVDTLTGQTICTYKDSQGRDVGAKMAFSEDNSLLAVTTSTILDKGQGSVSLINIMSSTEKCSYIVKYSWITSLLFDGNSSLYISCNNGSLKDVHFYEKGNGTIYKFDIPGNKEAWHYDSTKSSANMLNFATDDKSLLSFVAFDAICTLNTSNGSVGTVNGKSSSIINYIPLKGDEGLTFCGTRDGHISVTSLVKGYEVYADFTPHIYNNVKELLRGKGLLIQLPYNSRSLALFKYTSGSEYEKLSDFPYNINKVDLSKDDKYMVVKGYDSTSVTLFKTTDKKPFGELKVDGGDELLKASFVNDDKNVLIIGKKNLYLYETASAQCVNKCAVGEASDAIISNDTSLIAVNLMSGIDIYTTDLKKLGSYTDSYFSKLEFSNDNKYALVSNLSKFAILDIQSMKIKELKQKCSMFAAGTRTDQYTIINPESDQLELYSFKSETLKSKLKLSSAFVNSIGYFDNDSKIYINYKNNQTDIYESSKLKLIHSFKGLSGSFMKIETLSNSKNIVIYYTQAGYVCNKDYEIIAEVPGLNAVTKDSGTLYVKNTKTLGKFPLFNLKMLLDEAAKQLDGRTLTAEEKKEYFVN